MANGTGVKSVMVEFNRFGVSGGTLQKGTRYIRTAGYDVAAREIEVGLEYREFATSFYALRYPKGMATDAAALQALESEAEKMLRDLPCDVSGPVQIDLVTGAAELWAFPFEAWASAKPGVILTRRIRGEFGQHASWPPVPKVLFAHAATGSDLPPKLVNDHIAALRQALVPWTGSDPDEKTVGKYLTVKPVPTLDALKNARLEGDFTHIHLLAHGIPVSNPPFTDWGMRLGGVGTKGVHPSVIAEALGPQNGLPVTVTIASCDSANQSDSAAESYSIAQEIHRRGVPVVVASQLPLTMHGSKLLTEHFYTPLLRGDDVRMALAAAREALHKDQQHAFHDWLSVVAYVRLPENYDDHLSEVALKMELAMLRAAQSQADEVIRQNNLPALEKVEDLVRARIDSLDRRLQELKEGKDRLECQGLLASAHKRRAELLFLAGRPPAEQRAELEHALQHYSAAFRSNLNMHWQGVQQLALQAVLHGQADPIDYAIVMRGAQLATATDFWAFGTLAELHLLAPCAGRPPNPDAARQAVAQFRAAAAGKDADIDSTRRQLRRYVDWWIPKNEFKTELAAPAAELAAMLA